MLQVISGLENIVKNVKSLLFSSKKKQMFLTLIFNGMVFETCNPHGSPGSLGTDNPVHLILYSNQDVSCHGGLCWGTAGALRGQGGPKMRHHVSVRIL